MHNILDMFSTQHINFSKSNARGDIAVNTVIHGTNMYVAIKLDLMLCASTVSAQDIYNTVLHLKFFFQRSKMFKLILNQFFPLISKMASVFFNQVKFFSYHSFINLRFSLFDVPLITQIVFLCLLFLRKTFFVS